jgi:hypothetical protein
VKTIADEFLNLQFIGFAILQNQFFDLGEGFILDHQG